jgi:error-prone DNA polymerase
MTYIELHCHSNFSLLDGADFPETLVARAAELGMPALALTDHNALYGALRFAAAAKAHGIRPIFGAELTLTGGHHLLLLVENESGWGNLCRLISLARHNAPKGETALPAEALPGHTAGLIALSGCRRGEIPAALLRGDAAAALATARRYRDWFGADNFWIELQHHLRPDDDWLVARLVALATETGLGIVATNNVHSATRAGQPRQDVLVSISHLTSLAKAGSMLRPNSESYLKPGPQLAPLFAAYPEALANTLVLADRCRYEPHYGLQELPRFPTPVSIDAIVYLEQLCRAAMVARYPGDGKRHTDVSFRAPSGREIFTKTANQTDFSLRRASFEMTSAHKVIVRAERQLTHELAVIRQAGLANYFLIVWDIVRYCREQGIRCQGRGSAANSLVACLLGISPIDPLAHDLVFERFLSSERQSTPDIDLDIQADRREEVIQYVYQRYGHDHAAMACTVVTFRQRSARRDVARAVDIPPELLEDEERPGSDPLILQARDLCRQLKGFPRHLGIHNGGMIITAAPLADRLPIEPATMADRVVVQWDKESLETAGLVKIDLLGLRMLSALAEADGHLPPGQLAGLTFDDPAVYDLISSGETIGIFQVESRAQAQLQPRLQPRCFGDLVIAISLIRPGPIQGDMVHPYLRRRAGEEPVSYAHPYLATALGETLGVILFQEQVLKVARDLAGFTPGQGELLRRALGSKAGEAAVEPFRTAFMAGAQANGVAPEVAGTVFSQLQAFGGYAFAKSHAAAFAVLVYQSAWLKRYQPAIFYKALLNHQPMGFWSPAVLVGDARRHGVTVLPVDVVRSGATCELEGEIIRLGFNYVDGFGEAAIERLLAARQPGPFEHLADLCRRSRLPRRLVERLVRVGALAGWGIPRRELLWALGRLAYKVDELPLEIPQGDVTLPPLSEAEGQLWEQELLGLSTGPHLLSRYRQQLTRQGILSTAAVKQQPDGETVRLVGLLVVHQAPPTANGVRFLTLEDELGLVDVVLWPQLYQRYRTVIRNSSLLRVTGTIQRSGDTVSLLARQVAAASPRGM